MKEHQREKIYSRIEKKLKLQQNCLKGNEMMFLTEIKGALKLDYEL